MSLLRDRYDFVREKYMRDELNIKMREWWIKELREITERVIKEEEKRQSREKAKYIKKLGEYRTYNDIQEAYGVGVITEKQFDRLADLLEKSQPEPDELYKAKIELLQEMYQEQKKLIEEIRRHKHETADAEP